MLSIQEDIIQCTKELDTPYKSKLLHHLNLLENTISKNNNWRFLAQNLPYLGQEQYLTEEIKQERDDLLLQYLILMEFLSDYKALMETVNQFIQDPCKISKEKIRGSITYLNSESYIDYIEHIIYLTAADKIKLIRRVHTLTRALKNANKLENSKRGKNKATNPTKQIVIDRACEIWKERTKSSLDDVAEIIARENLTTVRHATIKSWIAPYNPNRKNK